MDDGIAVPRGGQSRGLCRSFLARNDDSHPESTRIASLRRTLSPGAQAQAVRDRQPRCRFVLAFGGSGRLEQGQPPPLLDALLAEALEPAEVREVEAVG